MLELFCRFLLGRQHAEKSVPGKIRILSFWETIVVFFVDSDLSLDALEQIPKLLILILLSVFNKKGVTENAFRILLPALVKPVHVELSDEGVDLLVSAELWKHHFLELSYILNYKLSAIGSPIYDPAVLFVLKVDQ